MSSHHFVKEFQEPALLILSLKENDIEKLESLLEWAPYVIVHENVFADILEKEIKIDAVLCKNTNRELILNLVEMQWNIELFEILPTNNLIHKSLSIVEKNGGRNLNVFDIANTLSIEFPLFESQHSQIVIFSQNIKWHLPIELKFEKWLPANTNLNFMSAKREALNIQGNFSRISDNQICTTASGLISISSSQNEKWLLGEPF